MAPHPAPWALHSHPALLRSRNRGWPFRREGSPHQSTCHHPKLLPVQPVVLQSLNGAISVFTKLCHAHSRFQGCGHLGLMGQCCCAVPTRWRYWPAQEPGLPGQCLSPSSHTGQHVHSPGPHPQTPGTAQGSGGYHRIWAQEECKWVPTQQWAGSVAHARVCGAVDACVARLGPFWGSTQPCLGWAQVAAGGGGSCCQGGRGWSLEMKHSRENMTALMH